MKLPHVKNFCKFIHFKSFSSVVCLLTYSSFFSLPTFALESEGAPANSPKITVESPKQVDQRIYRNLLENPTMTPEGNTIPGWTPCSGFNLSLYKTYFIKDGTNLRYASYSNYSMNSYISWDGNNINIYSENPGDHATLFSDNVNVLANRTYTSQFTATAIGYDYELGTFFNNNKIYSSRWIFNPGTQQYDYKPSNNGLLRLAILANTQRKGPLVIDRNKTAISLKYAEQWKAVDGLFTSLDHSTLAPSVSTSQINQVKTLVTNTSYNDDRTDMLRTIDRATQLLTKQDQELQQTILTQLEQLLVNGELAPNVTLELLQPIQALIDQLSDTVIKQPLQQKLQVVKDKILQKNISAQLEQLLINGELAPGITLGSLESIQDSINQISDSLIKQPLQRLLNTIKDKVYQKNILEQFSQLFKEEQLIEGVTSELLVPIQADINQVTDSVIKSQLQIYFNQIQKQVTQKELEERATKAVNQLFNGEQLADNVTAKMMNEAQIAIQQVPDILVKQSLEKRYQKAERLWDIKNFKITKVQPYKVNESTYIIGKYSGKNATYARPFINKHPSALQSLVGNPLGTFTYPITNITQKDYVSIAIYDSFATQLANHEVPILPEDPTEVTNVEPYLMNASIWLRGNYRGSKASYIRVIVKETTGTESLYPIVSLNETPPGEFRYYVPGLKATDEASIVLFDQNFHELVRQKMIVYTN